MPMKSMLWLILHRLKMFFQNTERTHARSRALWSVLKENIFKVKEHQNTAPLPPAGSLSCKWQRKFLFKKTNERFPNHFIVYIGRNFRKIHVQRIHREWQIRMFENTKSHYYGWSRTPDIQSKEKEVVCAYDGNTVFRRCWESDTRGVSSTGTSETQIQ